MSARCQRRTAITSAALLLEGCCDAVLICCTRQRLEHGFALACSLRRGHTYKRPGAQGDWCDACKLHLVLRHACTLTACQVVARPRRGGLLLRCAAMRCSAVHNPAARPRVGGARCSPCNQSPCDRPALRPIAASKTHWTPSATLAAIGADVKRAPLVSHGSAMLYACVITCTTVIL